MTTTVSNADSITRQVRIYGLDALRGFAIVMMIGQHVSLLFWGWNRWEATGGRAIAPIFFLVGGSLITRMTIRHGYVAVIGVAISVLIPWAGSPSSLLLYSVGAFVVWFLRCFNNQFLWFPVMVALTLYANGYGVTGGGYYTPWAVIGLMAVGSMIGRTTLGNIGTRFLPKWSWLRFMGRHPLSFYVGHVVLLEIIREVVIQ